MNEPQARNSTTFELETGRRIAIQADSPRGQLTIRGEIIYVSNHHFRVSVDARIPKGVLKENQEVRLVLESAKNVIPVPARFIRATDDAFRVLILTIPDGTSRRNRRAFFRGTIDAEVTITRSDGSAAEGRALNISGGGLLVETSAALQNKEELGILIAFPDGDRIIAKVRVVRMDETDEQIQYGVQFLEIRRRDQDRICRMVIVQEFENRRNEIRELNENTPFKQ